MGSPVSPIVANLFMEHFEKLAIATAPLDCKPKYWRRYVDDILEVIPRDSTQKLTDHLNQVDETGNIKFTYEEEENKRIPFLDTMIIREDDGHIKTQVYRKKTHTDQYLNFNSHHPLHHKMGVIRTLMDRVDTVVSTPEDKADEIQHIEEALQTCGYPKWSFTRTKAKIQEKKEGKNKPPVQKEKGKTKGSVVIPYVQGLTESISRVMKEHGITTAVKPYQTIRQILVKPKDKRGVGETAECVYKIPCKNCDRVYIGETGRKLETRVKEHKMDTGQATSKGYFTRSSRSESQTERHKSAITDHALQENHVIDWEGVKIMDRESDRKRRWIKEAIAIRKEEGKTINRDEGQYFLPGLYNPLLRKRSERVLPSASGSRNQRQH